jgi:hypothetical protein
MAVKRRRPRKLRTLKVRTPPGHEEISWRHASEEDRRSVEPD